MSTQTNHASDEDLRAILTELVLEVGKQVTEDYVVKHGIWEGMSIRNVKSLDIAIERARTYTAQKCKEAVDNATNFVTHTKESRVQSLSEDQISITNYGVSFGQRKPPFERAVIEYDKDNYLIRFHEPSKEEYGISYKVGKNPATGSYGFRARPFMGILPAGYYFRVSGETYKLAELNGSGRG